jgi:transposase-like protein
MNDNEENHTHKFFDNHYSWLWNLMDSTTRFWICSRLSQRRDTQAGVGFLKEMKKRAPLQKALVHDGLRVYDDAYNKELFTLKTPRIQNVRSISIGHEGLNSKVERLHGTIREREKVMRGTQTRETAQKVVDAMRINYNFVREHSTIHKTPAEKAGIKLNLGENKIETLIRLAANKAANQQDKC